MNKKRLVILAIILLLIILIIYYLFFNNKPQQIVLKNYSIPSYMSSAIPFSNNTIVFSNGRSFVLYNYLKGTTSLLSPDNLQFGGLSNLDSLDLSANKKFILFHSNSPNNNGVLGVQLKKDGISNSFFGNWWVYNISSQTFSPLSTNVIIAKMSGNTVYTLSNNNGVESISSYNPQNLNQISSVNVSYVSNFFPVRGGYLLQTPNNKVLFTNNGIVTQQLYSSTILDGVSANGQEAIGVFAQNGSQQLELLNIHTSVMNLIANNIIGQADWSSKLNEGFYYTNSTNSSGKNLTLNSYNLSLNKTIPLSLRENMGSTILKPLGNNRAIISQSQGNDFIIGKSLKSILLPKASYNKTIYINSQPIFISYSSQGIMYVNSTTYFPNEKNILYNQLTKDGFNPYLISIQIND